MNKTPGSDSATRRSPWFWIPSLYFAEGIPYAVVMLLSVVLYKRMGVSNTAIALYTSWLYLPWVIKPLWSPIVDILKTKRYWIIVMQILIGTGLGGVALTIPMPGFFKFTLGFFWLLAFSSATHDIAADGFYMLGLSRHNQAWYVGIRSTFYRISIIFAQGFLIMFAGYVESTTGLSSVETKVAVVTDSVTEPSYDLTTMDFSERKGDLRIIIEPEQLTIPIAAKGKTETDSLKAFADIWNSNRTAIEDLNQFLNNTLPSLAQSAETATNGNTGLFFIQLSEKPAVDEEIVVTFGQNSGDKSIALITATRLVFTADDWNKPALALIKIDPKLKHASSASYLATAGNIPLAWILTFMIMAGLFVVFFIYHRFILPYPDQDKAVQSGNFVKDYLQVFIAFFTKEKIALTIAFILIYRFGEAQLVKIAPLFMLDTIEAGGMALTTGQYGFIYGTMGAIALTLGGILGGFVAARQGLKYWILWMALAMKFPDVVYVFLSYAQPDSFALIASCVAVEQFGYGFGFTAYMLFMITVAEGQHKTAHYALCTGFMALGMMIPGMFSGWLQELIGYQHFFIWVLFCTIPGLLMIKFLPIDPEFGKKHNGAKND
ncbi:MAG: MFS transporter [Candidatus Marinimicrobia bacterium]|nr:MFS transporter [Candidatus Neomarinimicrobiota bacterium]